MTNKLHQSSDDTKRSTTLLMLIGGNNTDDEGSSLLLPSQGAGEMNNKEEYYGLTTSKPSDEGDASETTNDDDDDEHHSSSIHPTRSPTTTTRFYQVSLMLLVATFWTSTILFGTYIFFWYLLAPFENEMERWNLTLQSTTGVDQYNDKNIFGTIGIGLHFAAGAILCFLGPILLLPTIRKKYPCFHRWTGRVYILCCLLVSVGGLTFIITNGTVGKAPMNIGFATYGILLFLSAIQAYRYAAILKDYKQHSLWSMRLFALVMSSWLYRMELLDVMCLQSIFGWEQLHHVGSFTSRFDAFLNLFFYVPALLVVEFIWRCGKNKESKSSLATLRCAGGVALLFATVLVAFNTFTYSIALWLPAIGGVYVGDDYLNQ